MEDNVFKKPSETINSILEVGDDNTVDELRVLAIDAEIFSLQYLCAVLHKCNYKVKATTSAAEALEVLRANKHGFDIVLVDVDSANLNGFMLLKIIGLEMYLPVIMVTGDGSLENITQGLVYGAVDYILKPVGEQDIKISIRHHVTLNKTRDSEESSDYQEKSQDQIKLKPLEHSNASITVEEDKANIQSDDASSQNRKKKRLVWTPELDAKFVNAVQTLEKSSMVHPRRILDIMNEPGLTRENIASHLQKYRISLNKRKAEAESEANRQCFEVERVTQCSSIKRITKCRKWEVNEVNADRLAVPRGGITVMSQRMIPYVGSLVPTNPYGSFLYGCLDDPHAQTPDFKSFNYHNYFFENNIQPHNLGSEPPYFPNVGSEPSTLTGVPFPSINAFLAPETDETFQSPFAVSSVPNLVSGGIPNYAGITMDYTNNLQYPGSTIITGSGETHLVPNGTITSPTDISSQHNFKRENEVSEMDNNQVKNSLDEGCFNFFSLFNDQDHSGLTFSL